MNQSFFYPPRRPGYVFHGAAIVVLLAASAWFVLQAVDAESGSIFLLYILLALFSTALIPLLVYRLIALRNARYILERGGIRLVWGLRHEDVPMEAISWALPVQELSPRPPLPRLRWPGSVLGTRRTADGSKVEYLAASTGRLVVISLEERRLAISPDDPAAFLLALQRCMELGSLRTLPARSVYPGFFLARVWRAQPARYLLLGGLLLNLALLIWVLLVIPSRAAVTLGFGAGREPVPAVQLLLLPIISGFFYLVDSLLGLFLFRRGEAQLAASPPASTAVQAPNTILAYLLWGSAATVALLFLVVIFFIL